jgi:hypothetical protein
MPAQDVARGYQADVTGLSVRAARRILQLWRLVSPGDISGSWLRLLPEAMAVLAAAQTVAAELADPYLSEVVPVARAAGSVVADAFAGATLSGESLGSLLYRPVFAAKDAIAAGATARSALRTAEAPLVMYARSETTDAARQAVSAGMGVRREVTGYYRMLVPPSCSRCAILAGRRYGKAEAFNRHPHCDCVHIPVAEADDGLAFDAKRSIEAGNVTGLSKAELKAIELGADPAQVVNAHRGMYTSADGRYRYTREGTTRQGVAGARILARDAARLRGEDVTGRIFDNLTFTKEEARQYTALLRRGVKHTRLTKTGREQSYRYSFARTARPTPEQIMRDAVTPEHARRMLTNFGYILDRRVIADARATARLAADNFGRRFGLALKDDNAFGKVARGLGPGGGLTALERAALREYKSSFFVAINGQLRRGELDHYVGNRVAQIDGVMAGSRLRADTQVWRGIAHPERLFGDALAGDMTGVSWHELAYTSTSTSQRFARDFGIQGLGSTPVLMRILAPTGTGAATVGRDQAEVLLERGLRFRVVRDRGVSPDGYRLIDVEVLGR